MSHVYKTTMNITRDLEFAWYCCWGADRFLWAFEFVFVFMVTHGWTHSKYPLSVNHMPWNINDHRLRIWSQTCEFQHQPPLPIMLLPSIVNTSLANTTVSNNRSITFTTMSIVLPLDCGPSTATSTALNWKCIDFDVIWLLNVERFGTANRLKIIRLSQVGGVLWI